MSVLRISNTLRLTVSSSAVLRRSFTHSSTLLNNKRYLQTNADPINSSNASNKWSQHQFSLPTEEVKPEQKTTEPPTQPKKRRRQLKPRKQLVTLSANAVHHLTKLMNQPNPQLIRVGVRNRGCSGLSYHLEYVSKPEKFDEMIEQDGVKVLIDSKALFSIVGSEMDWVDDKLSSKFVFKNPNSKGTCGCGESFMV